FFTILIHPPPSSSLYPYTTLFRSLSSSVITAKYRIFRSHLLRIHLTSKMRTTREIPARYCLASLPAHIECCQPSTACMRSILIEDRKSRRLNSSHLVISYAVFCLK